MTADQYRQDTDVDPKLLAEFNRGTDRARRADRAFCRERDDRPLTSLCRRCGRRFATPQGLGSHRRHNPACRVGAA